MTQNSWNSTVPIPVTNGGTGTGTAFTAGSVVFAGASGVYNQDHTEFVWDDTNYRLGIGTNAPGTNLQIDNGSVSFGAVTVTGSYSASTTDCIIAVQQTAPATITLPSSVTTGRLFYIKDVSGNASTNNIMITPASGLIDGQSSITISVNFGFAQVCATGTGYFLVSSNLS